MENRGMEQQEEYSLFDILWILESNMKFIILSVCILMGIACIYLFVIKTPTYKAEATIMVSTNNTKYVSSSMNDIKKLYESLDPGVELEMNAIIDFCSSNTVLNDAAENLNKITDQSFTGEQLSKILDSKTIKGTNLIAISAEYSDPAIAQQIVNQLIASLVTYTKGIKKVELDQQVDFLRTEDEKKHQLYTSAYDDFAALQLNGNTLDELTSEYNSSVNMLVKAKEQLINLTSSYETTTKVYEQILDLLESTDRTIILYKSLGDNPELANMLSDTYKAKDLTGMMYQEEIINPEFQDLLARRNSQKLQLVTLESDRDSVKEQISTLESNISLVLPAMLEKQKKYDIAQQKLKLAEETYTAYEEVLNEKTIKQITEESNTMIIVTEAPNLPAHSQNELAKFLGIAFLLSIFLAIAFVFIRITRTGYHIYKENDEHEERAQEIRCSSFYHK